MPACPRPVTGLTVMIFVTMWPVGLTRTNMPSGAVAHVHGVEESRQSWCGPGNLSKSDDPDACTEGYGERTIGPGTSKRANARFTCVNTTRTLWRSKVDVDIIGMADGPKDTITESVRIGCGTH